MPLSHSDVLSWTGMLKILKLLVYNKGTVQTYLTNQYCCSSYIKYFVSWLVLKAASYKYTYTCTLDLLWLQTSMLHTQINNNRCFELLNWVLIAKKEGWEHNLPGMCITTHWLLSCLKYICSCFRSRFWLCPSKVRGLLIVGIFTVWGQRSVQ